MNTVFLKEKLVISHTCQRLAELYKLQSPRRDSPRGVKATPQHTHIHTTLPEGKGLPKLSPVAWGGRKTAVGASYNPPVWKELQRRSPTEGAEPRSQLHPQAELGSILRSHLKLYCLC